MKFSLILAFLTLLPFSLSAPGPIPPDAHPATSLRERIRKLRLSLDRELLTLAQLESSSPFTSVHQTAAETILDEDDGFTEVVNDGTGIFRPILPGVRAPAANEFPEPSDGPDGPMMDTPPPDMEIVTPVPGETATAMPQPIFESPFITQVPVDPMFPSPEPTRTPEVLPSEMPTPTTTPEVVTSPIPSAVGPLPPLPVITEEVTVTPIVELPTGPEETSPEETTPEETSPEETTPEETTPEEMITVSPDAAATSPPPPPEDDDPVCFPAEATVELEGGAVKRMEDVQLGDCVRVGPNEWSEVFMFTHKLDQVRSRFVKIDTLSGHSLELTRGHYLYVNGGVVPARTVKVGDTLMLADHTLTEVKNVGEVVKRGLYNPQTVHGDIVVQGVRATTYTTAVERRMAHALLAPIRAVYSNIGWTWGVFEGGADRLASLVPSGSNV